ncbi:response regulator [Streptomyces nanshensis]|uniref:response regulator transcription factor n=1 Tax=Streptomyces nanshensis TaxID=518642 RepID=UPI00085BE31A
MIRVLVVDDDFMVARLHSTLVGQVPGFTVADAVHSGTEALAAVRELRPDLVLLDMYLPDVPGLEVLRELRGTAAPGEGPDVLVVTAARDAETVRGAQRGGAVQYVIKPFEGHQLQERLREYAERREALASLQAPRQGDVDRLFGVPGVGATLRRQGGRRHREPPRRTRGPLRCRSGNRRGRRSGKRSGCRRRPRRPRRRPAAAAQGTHRADGPTRARHTGRERRTGGPVRLRVAGLSGLSRVSARRYLEHFVHLGTARVTLRYGTTGRPERRYHRVGPPRTEAQPHTAEGAEPGTQGESERETPGSA